MNWIAREQLLHQCKSFVILLFLEADIGAHDIGWQEVRCRFQHFVQLLLRQIGFSVLQIEMGELQPGGGAKRGKLRRSEEHTSELQSRLHLVCRLLLEKKKKNTQ